MDVADNTDELLRQYAGGQETRDPKKYFMFFQRADPILKEDGGE